MGDVVEATQKSIEAASHLDATGKDAGAIAALLALARKIDDWDTVVDYILEQIASDPDSKLRIPATDNVSLPTYLKYCESMGLTPAGRKVLEPKNGQPVAKVENELERWKREQEEKRGKRPA